MTQTYRWDIEGNTDRKIKDTYGKDPGMWIREKPIRK